MMLDLIKEGKSIIITTHYIQEAQQAQTVWSNYRKKKKKTFMFMC